jgi:hypothetical protein
LNSDFGYYIHHHNFSIFSIAARILPGSFGSESFLETMTVPSRSPASHLKMLWAGSPMLAIDLEQLQIYCSIVGFKVVNQLMSEWS